MYRFFFFANAVQFQSIFFFPIFLTICSIVACHFLFKQLYCVYNVWEKNMWRKKYTSMKLCSSIYQILQKHIYNTWAYTHNLYVFFPLALFCISYNFLRDITDCIKSTTTIKTTYSIGKQHIPQIWAFLHFYSLCRCYRLFIIYVQTYTINFKLFFIFEKKNPVCLSVCSFICDVFILYIACLSISKLSVDSMAEQTRNLWIYVKTEKKFKSRKKGDVRCAWIVYSWSKKKI